MGSFPPARNVTIGPNHHFFGYYDKCPWDASGRYLLALETRFIDRPPVADDTAVIGMIDLHEADRFIPLVETRAWNWQQGTMLRWLPNAPDRMVVYNHRDGDRYVSVIRDIHSAESRALPLPVYAISNDGRCAVTTSFSRIHRRRPGYGYAGVPDAWADDPHPDEDGITWMDLDTGRHRLIISLGQIAAFRPDATMHDSQHWFNHLLFSPDDARFAFLHRWVVGSSFHTRLFTANPDGTEIRCLSDYLKVSHYDWRDPGHVLAWARRKDIGERFFLFRDKSPAIEAVGEGTLTVDGHCSYSPDRRWILTDTYPDRETHLRTLLLYHPADHLRIDIGQFYSPPELTGEIRCDLHPRWNRNGTQVCIDSAHEGHRQVYVIDVGDIVMRG